MGAAIIRLMRGVVYRETDEDSWLALQHQGAPIRDHFATIGLDVVVDDTEGYAYLRSVADNEEEQPLPRLVMRRSLTYNVSLLLVLLRKRLVEFETSGSEGKLVLSVTNPDSGSATEELPVEYDQETLDIGFNSRYLLDIAGQLETESALFRFSDPGSPTLISDDAEPSTALYVLMPMRV